MERSKNISVLSELVINVSLIERLRKSIVIGHLRLHVYNRGTGKSWNILQNTKSTGYELLRARTGYLSGAPEFIPGV